MLAHLKKLIESRDLLWAWSARIISARYQQSALGGLWAIAQPVAMVIIFTIVFTRFVPVDTGGPPYLIFAYVTLVPWTLFATSLGDMTNSLVENMSLVNKIYFPREILPISAMLARLLDFFIAASLVIIMVLYFQISVEPMSLLYLPLILLTQLALAMGLGFIGATLNIFYRDVRYLVTVGIQLWFYASPIIYSVQLVPENIRPFYFLNPMAGVLEAYRDVILHNGQPGYYIFISATSAVVLLFFGYWFMKRLEFRFADIV